MSQHRIAIVGAGVLGLMHALAAARRGDQVTVFERHDRAIGASVRNFGLGLLVGQPQGELLDLARRSREMWLSLLPAIGCWHKAQGSLTVARNATEWAVLEGFQAAVGDVYGTMLLTAEGVAAHHAQGVGGLFSPHELAFESRVVIPTLTRWLAQAHGVNFRFNTQVNAIALPHVDTSAGRFAADQVIVCSGHDFQTLYPETFAPLGIRQCSLQMLRIAYPGVDLGPALLTGLSALHYPSFTQCVALGDALAALRNEVEETAPAILEHGIHLIVQQVGSHGDLVVGDSHHYGEAAGPFNQTAIDAWLQGLAEDLLGRPLHVTERWQGVYASGPRPYEVLRPAEGVMAVAMTAGIGMSVAPALAERLLAS